MQQTAIARIRQSDGKTQDLEEHLLETSLYAEIFSGKIGLPQCGRLLGLVHDLGKYSAEFQNYIMLGSQTGEGREKALARQRQEKGKIDHSTAGAQWIWETFLSRNAKFKVYAQMLALAACSHHSGLIDCLTPKGERRFHQRMEKDDKETFAKECLSKTDRITAGILQRFPLTAVQDELKQKLLPMIRRELGEPGKAVDKDDDEPRNRSAFARGLLARFLLSCLTDADRISSAGFEDEDYAALRSSLVRPGWKNLSAKLERWLADKAKKPGPIQAQRQSVSDACLARGKSSQGFFTLTVPTGGGKTLASLRFALAHAAEHSLDRIIYVIPYTSIIDQNAQVAREILEQGEDKGSIVLEHHSNIQPEEECYRHIRLASNWESPIVFTTMVQFLETLFGSGTRNVRRMHTLARSVIIFDEIQTLPIRCTHMFCNALNFLVHDCGASALLCTATQPLLGELPNPAKGQLCLTKDNEITPDPSSLFQDLRRVEFINHCGSGQKFMDEQAIAALALNELEDTGSCLIVCNTKKWAERLYRRLSTSSESCHPIHSKAKVFYLSTHLCPAHRREILEAMRQALADRQAGKGPPVICCSTQVIECGVDVDFGSVIRFAAGLDSILQAAGRCNRNGLREAGRVHIVQPPQGEENLDSLEEINIGKAVFLRLMNEDVALSNPGSDLTRPELIERYFRYYFHERAKLMDYRVKDPVRDDSLLCLLGSNRFNTQKDDKSFLLRQSFATAAGHFRPIATETQGVLVPFGKRGKELIANLFSRSEQHRARSLLREAQQYSVNLYPGMLKKLRGLKALEETLCPGVYSILPGYYHSDYGVTEEWTPDNGATCA